MRELKGNFEGTVVVRDAVHIKGMLKARLVLEHGAEVTLSGIFTGEIVVNGGKLDISGIVKGDVTNAGGTLNITGIVSGRLSELGGTTHVAHKALVSA